VTSLRVPSPGGVSRLRLWLVAAAFLAGGVICIWSLHSLQIVRVEEHRARARRQQEHVVKAEPRRGKILDRMGRPLAVSADAWSVYASAERLTEVEGAERRLAGLLEIPVSRLHKKLRKGGFILAAKRLAPDVADSIRREELPGVELITEAKRFYPRGELAAHVLGFVVDDNPGLREGLESRYDDFIKGTPGTYLTLHDAQGRHLLLEEKEESRPGNDIVTTLDEVIQHIAERELASAVHAAHARAGSVVVLHTPTGEVLAMANYPTFNPNRYGKAPASARRNRAVMDFFEPGSTFKMVTAAAAIEEGLVRSSEAIDCGNGQVQVAGKTIHDHKPFATLSFREAIEKSSNGCAIKVGLRLNPRVFFDYITRFGFGSRSGIDLPLETKGLLRPVSEWSKTSQAYVSFGQEVGVSALQIAAAFSTIANRGVYVAPRVVSRILDPAGRSVTQPEAAEKRRVISESTANVLVDLMEGVVFEGTGAEASVPGYRVAGKTGTAQKYVSGPTYSENEHIASFCGFVPVREPVLTIHVILDNPGVREFHGGDVAAPAFRKIAAPVLEYLDVPREPSYSPLHGLDMAAQHEADPGRRAEAVVPASRRETEVRPVKPARFVVEAPAEENLSAVPVQPVVPDLMGASLRDAVVGLARLGLHTRVEGEGFVVAQLPLAGEMAGPGATVSLKLARSVRHRKGSDQPSR